ncbi:MAG: hypothetical protein IT383_17725 [Deltaproteobacteria bacterium]|nr:hypothetical protein [Deltaproteobacteria bacterium]
MEDTPAPPQQHAPRSTVVTLALFLVVCGALAAAPLPSWLKPLDLSTPDAAERVARRVLAKPKMTLQHVEERLAAQGGDGRDAPEGEGIDQSARLDAEERELLTTRDARADVEALKDVALPAAVPERPRVVVDRAAVAARITSPKADAFRAQAKSVNAPGAAVVNPCVLEEPAPMGGVRCARTALDPFFGTLDAIAAGDTSARAAAVVLGNSLIASDHVTDVVRARLVERFGDAGRGFLLPDRLSKVAGRKVRTGEATAGWEIQNFAQDPPDPKSGKRLGPFGFTGSLHVSTVKGDHTTWRTDGAARARLFYLEHGGQPAMRLEARTKAGKSVVARIEAMPAVAPEQDVSVDVVLPAATRELVLVAEGPGAQVYGVALEGEGAGVVVDTIGVPAASAQLYVEATSEEVFVRQLRQREPSLFVAMLGGNEVRSLDYKTIDPARFDAYLTELLARAKSAAPESACLIVSPIDAVKASAAGEELTTRPEIDTVIEVQRAVAKREGCAFFDLFAAMGGKGSLTRFKDKGFLSEDLVHPTWRGGDVLGQLFADALVQSWIDTAVPEGGIAIARRRDAKVPTPRFAGLTFPSEEQAVVVVKSDRRDAPAPRRPLARFFEQLRALERGEVTRVAIGQLGASHTAGQMWTDRMRERLTERFGNAGRGFISVGRESKRLASTGVVRTLEGGFEIADGREVMLGGTVGMSGTKARLEPGARFAVDFCGKLAPSAAKGGARHAHKRPASCPEARSAGTLQIAWLATPDMGSADVAVDGTTVATISPEVRNLDSDVQLLRLPIDEATASLEIVVHAPAPKKAHGKGKDPEHDAALDERFGPVHLLSVSEERARSGVVLDAVGLPGTTGMTPQRWRQDIVAEEARSRDWDLLVTAWGTNEAGIASLDEVTYRHHFTRTLDTLLQASPRADCLIIGASDRQDQKHGEWRAAPAHELVERVQRQVAADRGCAFFSLRTAMGGAGSVGAWLARGLANVDHVHFTAEGYAKLGDLIVDDLLAAYAHDAALAAAAAQEELARAQGDDGNRTSTDVDRRGG